MKKCNKCEVEKTISHFGKAKVNSDGYNNRCKQCIGEYQAIYRANNIAKAMEYNKEYYKDNNDSILQQKKMYYQENKETLVPEKRIYYSENRDEILEGKKQYYQKNKGRILKNDKQYYIDNKDEVRARAKLYRQNNPNIYRKASHKRKAREKGVKATLTVSQWNEVKKYFNNSCAYCEISEKEHLKLTGQRLHQEHFVALINGGSYSKENIMPSCKSCNSSKSNKDFFEWYSTHEHYDLSRENIIIEYLKHTQGKAYS